jgi:hypothetical protein
MLPFIFIAIFILIVVFVDKLILTFEKIWTNLSNEIYDPTVDSYDPFGEFTGLDQNQVQDSMKKVMKNQFTLDDFLGQMQMRQIENFYKTNRMSLENNNNNNKKKKKKQEKKQKKNIKCNLKIFIYMK